MIKFGGLAAAAGKYGELGFLSTNCLQLLTICRQNRQVDGGDTRGPCQGPGEEDGTLCGETLSTFWYGKSRQGVHFCSNHRAAWEQFKLNGTAEKADETTALTMVDELLGTRYCEPSRMARKQRRNKVEKGASTLQFCVQGTFNCAQDDARGEPDTSWLTLDELLESDCSREEFVELSAKYVEQLQKTFKQATKRFRTMAQVRAA